jgi:Tfp pilus assembly protein PilO
MSNIPEQNPPVNEANNKFFDNQIKISLLLATIIVSGLGYWLNILGKRIDEIDKKYQADHDKVIILDKLWNQLGLQSPLDHDKITVLESKVKILMKHIEPKAK